MTNWQQEISAASARINGHILRTPTAVIAGPGLSRPIEVKFEQMQHTGSFKPRGAFNTLLTKTPGPAGLVAASGGNHGAAVAYAARQLGHPARIYVPEIAGPSKIALIRDLGADLQVVPGAYANAFEQALAWEAETGAEQVHAYDTVATVAGQGSLAMEWEDQGLSADTVLVAAGGGGLIAGVAAWLNGRRKVVSVEPKTCSALNSALKNGAPIDVDISGVASNALGAKRIGQICFDVAKETAMQSVLVEDQAITEAQRLLWKSHRQLVEPAGATALAALISGAYTPERDEKIAVLVCGANIAPDPFQ